MEMTTLQAELHAANQKTLDSAQDIVALSLETTERLMKLHMESTKAWLDEAANHLHAVLGAGDAQEVQVLRGKLVEAFVERALSQAPSVYQLAVEAKGKMAELFETQVTALNEGLVSVIETAFNPVSVDAAVAIAAAKSSVATATAAIGTLTAMPAVALPAEAAETETRPSPRRRAAELDALFTQIPYEAIVTSCDGYIRMSLKRLALLQFVHVASACDQTLLPELLLADAVPAGAAGYTEWTSKTAPFVSLGWDWYCDDVFRHCLLINEVRSNIMLVDSQGYDLGTRRSAHFIASWLGALEWQAAVLAAADPGVSFHSIS
jgi:phasin family protein